MATAEIGDLAVAVADDARAPIAGSRQLAVQAEAGRGVPAAMRDRNHLHRGRASAGLVPTTTTNPGRDRLKNLQILGELEVGHVPAESFPLYSLVLHKAFEDM